MIVSQYIIIVGGGKVGYHLARHLMERDYEITLIEKNRSRAEWIEHHIGSLNIMVGDGDEMAFLATTGIERAAVVVACTGDDEDNLVVCQIAKFKFRVPKTIARVNTPHNVAVFKALGVDVALSATEVLMGLIETELGTIDTIKGLTLKTSGVSLVDVAVGATSPLVGKQIATIQLPEGEQLVCVLREEKPVHHWEEAVVAVDDELIIYSRSYGAERIVESFTTERLNT